MHCSHYKTYVRNIPNFTEKQQNDYKEKFKLNFVRHIDNQGKFLCN